MQIRSYQYVLYTSDSNVHLRVDLILSIGSPALQGSLGLTFDQYIHSNTNHPDFSPGELAPDAIWQPSYLHQVQKMLKFEVIINS